MTTASNDVRTCATCAFQKFSLLAHFGVGSPLCARPNKGVNLVTGKPAFGFCEIERSKPDTPGYCNQEGRYHSSVFSIKEMK